MRTGNEVERFDRKELCVLELDLLSLQNKLMVIIQNILTFVIQNKLIIIER